MKKTLLAAMLAFTLTCGSALAAMAVDSTQTIAPDTVAPYSEAEDPLANQQKSNWAGYSSPDSDSNAYSAGKVSQYSFLTQKTYQIPSGYNVFHGIDVSKWEGSINWSKVKNAGIDYAILRVGYRGTGNGALYEDPMFDTYIEDALSVGIPVGVYIYSQALTTEEARAEANFVLQRIKEYQISLPVVMDYEFYGNDGRLYNAHLSKAEMTANALAFCETVSDAGYQPMLYANKSFLTENIYASEIEEVAPIWLAHYTTDSSYTGDYDQWQYSESGRVSGINTNVDCNFYLTKGSLVPELGDSIKGFTDVLSGNWYAEAVSFVVDQNLMTGTSSTTFSPNMSLNRVMAAQILYSLSGKPAVSYSAVYKDVPAGAWYTNAVIWANKNGIMSGYPNGTFGVKDVITREQIATILYSYSKKYGVNTSSLQNLSKYTDASKISSYAITPMQWAVANGIISGRTTTTLEPNGSATRAECAAMLKSYLTGIGASLI